jgi:hypothetical protein
MLSHPVALTILVLLTMHADAVTLLQGVIHENEMSGRPMANIQVAGDGANPTTSESFGRFTLAFPNKNPGDPAEVIVNKEGYVAVNDVQLKLALPAHPEYQVLMIILCKEVDADEMRRRFYRIKSTAAIDETYTRRKRELETQLQATPEGMNKLQQDRDQAKAAAGRTFEFLAQKRPGQNSELYGQAERSFLDGDVNRAIELLNGNALNLALAVKPLR